MKADQIQRAAALLNKGIGGFRFDVSSMY